MSYLLLGLGAVLCAGRAAAQQQPLRPSDVSVNAEGRCNDAELARLPNLNEQRLVRGLGFTYVVREPKLTRTVGRTSAPITTQPNLFEHVVIYGLDQQSSRLLVGFRNRRHCGWTDPDTLLFRSGAEVSQYSGGPQPVRVKDGPDGANNLGNELNLKVVLQNLNTAGQDGAPVLPEPGAALARTSKRLKLFFVFEVFDWKKAADPDDGNFQKLYYLVGRQGEVDKGGRLEGWVHERDLYVWTSRIAAFWGGTGEGRGYVDKGQLDGGKPAITEPERGKLREPEGRTVQRFPVISQEPSAAEVVRQQRAAPTPDAVDQLIRNYRIAMPGCAKDARPGSAPSAGPASAPGSAPGAGPAEEECTSASIDEIELKRQRLATIDVLFVIDATKSMEPYFPAVRKAVQRFIDKLDPTGLTLRAGVVTYGDYTGDEPSARGLQFEPVIQLQPLDKLKQELAKLNDVKMFPDKHNDRPEASFAAVIRAASTPWWAENAGIRYLVHIGDHGNRKKGEKSGASGSNLVERYDEEDVVRGLKSNSIIYVPIPVLGTYHEADNGAFVAQARKIRSIAPTSAAEVRLTYSPGQRQESEADRVNAVHGALNDGIGISQDVRDRIARSIECAQNERSPICQRAPQSESTGWMGDIVRGLEESMGLTRDAITRIYGRRQTVTSYYFKPRTTDGRQAFTYWVAMEDVPLSRLARVVADLCENIDRADGARFLKRSLDEVLEVGSGDTTDNVADLIAKKLFIPAYHLNPLLSVPWREMEDRLRHDAGTPRMTEHKKSFCRSSRLLGWVQAGKRLPLDDLLWDDAAKSWKARDERRLRDYKWNHDGGTGVPLYYVPIEFLPN